MALVGSVEMAIQSGTAPDRALVREIQTEDENLRVSLANYLYSDR